ncbi:MAG: FkbM family methyltransferase [Halobacteriovoraceae bacterium]|nr:FkbM family methyltransferase [Halobacteriovoraceae bacterium]
MCEEILLGIGWDEQLKDIISESINKYPQRPCIEIGANIGAGFITLAGNFPNTNFDCFEPVPRFFELLKANKKSYNADNVTLFNQALSDSIDTEIEIAVGLGTAGRPETAGKNEFIKLKTINLDSLYLEKGASLIKLVRQA